MNYKINQDFVKNIDLIQENLFKSQLELQTEFMFFNEYGKILFERKEINSPAFIQLAILAAYYRAYNK